jgi:hypothetical protein
MILVLTIARAAFYLALLMAVTIAAFCGGTKR